MTENTPCPTIRVYASLPRNVALGANLNMNQTNWHWIHCLSFPLDTLNELQFSHRPYKWIRYTIGIVIGAEGHLSTSSHSFVAVDYDAGLPVNSVTLYYHTSDEERRRMFPIDPQMEHTTITSSAYTSRRVEFHSEVAGRDGRQCILTPGLEELYCDAVHLLAHSKGDEYISNYTRRRSRDPNGADIIDNINNVQNGLFLSTEAHRGLGKHLAFLQTPNFAMNTADIDPNVPPQQTIYTSQYFKRPIPGVFPPGPLRVSDTPNFPPAILFDAVYACTVIEHFGTQVLKDVVTPTWKDVFYESGKMDYKNIMDKRAAKDKRREARAQERYEARQVPDAFDILLGLPYLLVPPDELQSVFREAHQKVEAEEKQRVREKVETWRQQATGFL